MNMDADVDVDARGAALLAEISPGSPSEFRVVNVPLVLYASGYADHVADRRRSAAAHGKNAPFRV